MSEDSENQALRRTRRDSRRDPGDLIAYETPTGDNIALTGDDHAPYVYALGRATDDGTAIASAQKGDPQFLLTDTQGRLYVQAVPAPVPAVLTYHSAAAEGARLLRVGPTRLYQIRAITAAAVVVDRFVQVFDLPTSPPSGGVSPVWEALIPSGQTSATQYAQAADDFEPIGGLLLPAGAVVALSTTPGVYTPAGNEGFFLAAFAAA